jgi:LemA protein
MRGALGALRATAEAYPDLEANESFRQLMAQLEETEDRIAGSRGLYNAVVERLNTLVQQVPTNLIASVANVGTREFYRPEDDDERRVPAVQLQAGGGG